MSLLHQELQGKALRSANPLFPPSPLMTSPAHHHRGRGPTQRFKPTDLILVRVQVVTVQHQPHFENVACDVMCEQNCTVPDRMNRVRTNLVRVAPSNLILGESGLFARQDIEEGSVVMCSGCGRERREHAPDWGLVS
jgi:hypothetical protein